MITAKTNSQIKLYKKLKLKKYRDELGMFLIYGEHLIEVANQVGAIEVIITSNPNYEGLLVSKEIMQDLSQTETTFEIMAVCKKVMINKSNNQILALDDVRDPNNLGALIRSAVAFGFETVLLSEQSADLYNEKVIRASQGAIFHVAVKRGNLVVEIARLKDKGYQIVIADAHGNDNYLPKANLQVLVLGNEGSGISTPVKLLATNTVTIKTKVVESLNVAVAGAILMYRLQK